MPRGRGHGWRRGYSRRVARMLEPTLLLLLHHEPAHGYTLLEKLSEFGLGGFDPSVVYRALREMEARDWVTSTWDDEQTQGPPRRVYCLAAQGDEVLKLWARDLEETRRMIDHLLNAYRSHMEDGEGEHH
jgi:PadR family transcriptional regulator PadR